MQALFHAVRNSLICAPLADTIEIIVEPQHGDQTTLVNQLAGDTERFAGAELFENVVHFCQRQIGEEKGEEKGTC